MTAEAASGPTPWSSRVWVLIGACIIALQAAILLAMGQPPICACRTIKFWHGIVLSDQNSQQLTDWYTFSHVIHGFGFYLLLWLVLPRASIGLRLVLPLGLEAGWDLPVARAAHWTMAPH